MAAVWLAMMLAVKLYLADGSFQMAREYRVEGDRVKYYSTERGEWEEIPVDLVDLKKTKAELEALEADRKASLAADVAEERAERERAREIARVPMNPGVYWLDGGQLQPLKQAESKVVTDKRRSVWKALSPLPVVSGKATLEVDGLASANVVQGDRPEFYMRLSREERFGIVKLSANKGNRIVERWTIIPVSKEVVQQHDDIEVFRQQVDDDLYKVWPQKPLEPGEYAFIQYTEGKANTEVWDFSVRGASGQ